MTACSGGDRPRAVGFRLGYRNTCGCASTACSGRHRRRAVGLGVGDANARCTSVAYTPPREYMCAKTAARLPLAYKGARARANERLRQHGGVVRGARGAVPAQRLWHARRQQRLDRSAAAAEHGAGRRRRVPDAAADRGAPAGPHKRLHASACARVRLRVRPRARCQHRAGSRCGRRWRALAGACACAVPAPRRLALRQTPACACGCVRVRGASTAPACTG